MWNFKKLENRNRTLNVALNLGFLVVSTPSPLPNACFHLADLHKWLMVSEYYPRGRQGRSVVSLMRRTRGDLNEGRSLREPVWNITRKYLLSLFADIHAWCLQKTRRSDSSCFPATSHFSSLNIICNYIYDFKILWFIQAFLFSSIKIAIWLTIWCNPMKQLKIHHLRSIYIPPPTIMIEFRHYVNRSIN